MTDRHRVETGAFYTPKVWADFCVARLHEVLPTFDGFTFYDPAAGEGALLDALPDGTDCYASTLESGDVEILKRKGYEAEQFDFLTMNVNFLHPNILVARDDGREAVRKPARTSNFYLSNLFFFTPPKAESAFGGFFCWSKPTARKRGVSERKQRKKWISTWKQSLAWSALCWAAVASVPFSHGDGSVQSQSLKRNRRKPKPKVRR